MLLTNYLFYFILCGGLPRGQMPREDFAKRIHWKFIIWLLGITNPFVMVPQLSVLLTSGRTEGVSILTLVILMCLQAGFSAHGFFLRDRPLMFSNGSAALVTLLTAMVTIYFRM